MKRIYICGPMRGLPSHNFPAFNKAASRFRAAGWVVVNPVEVGMLFANNPDVDGSEYIREDLIHLARCQAIALLPGWENSVGARCEVVCAITLGLAFYGGDGHPSPRPERVVCRGGYEVAPGAPASLDALATTVAEWQAVTFPRSTPTTRAEHLLREAAELRAAPTDADEMADCFILLVGVSAAAGVDLVSAVERKMIVNRARVWGEPDAQGVVEHVEAVDA